MLGRCPWPRYDAAMRQPTWKEHHLESSPPLAEDEVHVWRLDLDGPPQSQNLLSAGERERCNSFRHPQAARRYLNTRALTRRILAAYLNQSPDDLNLAVAEGGKPYLPDHQLEFNLSHSQGLGLLAVGHYPLGVDLEQLRPRRYMENIAARLFGAGTASRLRAMDEEEGQHLFFRHWTAMEARQKTLGRGIFEQPVTETRAPCRHFIPAEGFIAAIATTPGPLPEPVFLKPA